MGPVWRLRRRCGTGPAPRRIPSATGPRGSPRNSRGAVGRRRRPTPTPAAADRLRSEHSSYVRVIQRWTGWVPPQQSFRIPEPLSRDIRRLVHLLHRVQGPFTEVGAAPRPLVPGPVFSVEPVPSAESRGPQCASALSRGLPGSIAIRRRPAAAGGPRRDPPPDPRPAAKKHQV